MPDADRLWVGCSDGSLVAIACTAAGQVSKLADADRMSDETVKTGMPMPQGGKGGREMS